MHYATDARPGRGPHHEGRAVDVRAQHRLGILDAERIHPRDVKHRLAAVHSAGERLGVEQVAAHDPCPPSLECGRRRVGTGQGDQLVAARLQPLDEGAAHRAAAARHEDAAHGLERSTDQKRTR